MNRLPPSAPPSFTEQLAKLQQVFVEAYGEGSFGGPRNLDLTRLRQLSTAVQASAATCRNDGAQLLLLARTAQDVVPVTPTRRGLNEYFALFTNTVEPGLTAPPPMQSALTAVQTASLRQQVSSSRAQREARLAAQRVPLYRTHELEGALRDALTLTHGAHPDVRELELRLVAGYVEACAWPSALKQLQSFVGRFGPALPTETDSAVTQAALRCIAKQRALLCQLLDRAVAAADPEWSPLDVAALQVQIGELERVVTSAAPVPAAVAAPTDRAVRTGAGTSLSAFTELRQQILQLGVEEGLRQRVVAELETFDGLPAEQQTHTGRLLKNLAKLPPLRKLEEIEQPRVATDAQRNALRVSLRREFAALVVGHTSLREHIIEGIIDTIASSGTRGWTISLRGEPGIGKNTIAKAVARALQRELVEVVCAGRTKSEEILGSLKAYVGAEPGIAANILMTQKKPAVILWDELGKATVEVQNTLNTILDPDRNSQVEENYFAMLPLDFSTAIHVVTYNSGESVLESVLRRGTQFTLEDLVAADKEEIFRRASASYVREIYGADTAVHVSEATRQLMIERRIDEPGMGTLLPELRAVVLQSRRVRDGGWNLAAIPPEIAMEQLDGARADTRVVGREPSFALVSDLTAHRGTQADGRPARLIWHVHTSYWQWRLTLSEEGCTVRLVDGAPFLGSFGVAVLGEGDVAQSLFIDERTRQFTGETTIKLAAARFVDRRGEPETAALEALRADPSGKKLRFVVRLLSPEMAASQTLRQLKVDLGANYR